MPFSREYPTTVVFLDRFCTSASAHCRAGAPQFRYSSPHSDPWTHTMPRASRETLSPTVGCCSLATTCLRHRSLLAQFSRDLEPLSSRLHLVDGLLQESLKSEALVCISSIAVGHPLHLYSVREALKTGGGSLTDDTLLSFFRLYASTENAQVSIEIASALCTAYLCRLRTALLCFCCGCLYRTYLNGSPIRLP